MREINETNAELIEIGGNMALPLFPDKTTAEVLTYFVKEYSVVETEYGKRVDFIVGDDFAEWRVSSWNIVSKKKYKPADLIGKKIRFEKVLINDKAKFKLEVLD